MKAAVIGGTGFVGSHLVRKLINEGNKVSILKWGHADIIECASDNLRVVEGDIDNLDSLSDLFSGCDVVFHLAAKTHDPFAKDSEYFKVNVEGTKNVANIAEKQGVKKIVFFSSIKVYGKDANDCDDENSSCNPNDAYGKSKLEAETFLLEKAKKGKFDLVVLRLPIVYGPHDKGNIRRMIQGITKKRFIFLGDGLAKRSMVYAENVAEAAHLAAKNPCGSKGDIFCITDNMDYSIKELVEAICDTVGTNWRPIHLPLPLAKCFGRCGDLIKYFIKKEVPIDSDRVRKLTSSLTFSCFKAKKKIGYRPVKELKMGIQEEIKWMKEEGIL